MIYKKVYHQQTMMKTRSQTATTAATATATAAAANTDTDTVSMFDRWKLPL